MFLPKSLSHHQERLPWGAERPRQCIILGDSVLKRESKNASLTILFLSSQLNLEPRKLICGINDVSGQDIVCRAKGGLTASLYTNNPQPDLLLSLSAFSPLALPRGKNMKTFSGGGQGEEEPGMPHLHYWPNKSRARLSVLRAQLSWQRQSQGAGGLWAIVWSTKSLCSFVQAGEKNTPSQKIQTWMGRNSHT